MGIVLTKLSSCGPDKEDAEVEFHSKRRLIRGPSDTGKSYIRDCLWYMLGGDKPPKTFPLAEGYQELRLRFTSGEDEYEIRRSLYGGGEAVYVRPLGSEEPLSFEPIEPAISDLLVSLAGASGKQILRNKGERGPVTGDDIRHWALWSQTDIPAEYATAGQGYGVPRRIASFNLFLTGNDDASIQISKSKSEVERLKGQLTSAETALARIQAGLPADVTRVQVTDALDKVDATLAAMTSQYEARATKLKELRTQIADTTISLTNTSNKRNHAQAMIGRFRLLEEKYANDLERLGATSEGVAFFQELPMVDCPLCGTPTEAQVDAKDLQPEAPNRYRVAIAAEIEKIQKLRRGLLVALEQERGRHVRWSGEAEALSSTLSALQSRESVVVASARIEFTADPKTLALRRSDLSAQLAIFDEIERLTGEIARLKKSKVRKRVDVDRDGGTHGRAVANHATELLEAWGFSDIQNISLDGAECDLVINDRPRLSYGAGRRSLYLSALVVALMEYALQEGHPHLGVVVIDSPLKSYADVTKREADDKPLSTVRELFYRWLSTWSGRGQVIVLENEVIPPAVLEALDPIEFSGLPGVGRPGFYPDDGTVPHGAVAEPVPGEDGGLRLNDSPPTDEPDDGLLA